MEVLVLIVVLAATVLVGTTIGGRYRVAPPVLLITMGGLLALLPPLSDVVLEPEVVLLLFLPAVLYRESLVISLREIRANLLVIASLAVALVVVTMVAVALIAKGLGMSPQAAWVLGAVLAPTDAAAVAGLAKRMPRRILTTLRAESLVNDGTALVLFSVTVGLIVGGTAPGVLGFLGRFVGSAAGGVAAGLAVGLVVVLIRRRLDDPLREGALSVLTPFAAFLLAEVVHASGVLAVVVAGLLLSYASPRIIRARSRLLAYAFWDLSTFLINGALFVLLGMQIPRAVNHVTSTSLVQSVTIAASVTLMVVVVRLVWLQLFSYGLPVVGRGAGVSRRVRVAAGWAGFRGAVSLAAALAVPVTTATTHQPVPERDLIIFCTAVAIVSIMLVQGITLPAVARWAGLRGDEARGDEVRHAHRRTTEVALAALPNVAADLDIDREAVDRARDDYQRHLDLVTATSDGSDADRVQELDNRLRLGVLEHKRREVTRLRDNNEIDDSVLREVQATLDIEEIRLLGPQTED